MIRDVLKKKLRAQIKMEALSGKIGDKPFIPSNDYLDEEVERRISASGPLHKYAPINKNEVSSVSKLGKMGTDMVFDLQTLKDDIRNQREIVQNITDTSNTEFENSSRELNHLIAQSRALDLGIPLEALSYSVNDSFDDTSKINLNQTNCDVDTETGKIALDHTGGDLLDLSHHRTRNVVIKTEMNERYITQRYSLPHCDFSNLFNNTDSDKWMYLIKTTEAVPVSISFAISLAPNGESRPVNLIRLASVVSSNYKSMRATIYWRNAEHPDWTLIPTSDQKRVVDGTEEWSINWNNLTGYVTELKFVLEKDAPDYENTYVFSLRELSIKAHEYQASSTFISRSQQISSYKSETNAITTATLVTDGYIPEGSKIEYFVGLDEPVYGSWKDTNGTSLPEYSEVASQFVPDSSGNYVFKSELRENSHLTGATDYEEWEPKWIQIDPVNAQTGGNPTWVQFENHNLFDMEFNEDQYCQFATWGGGKIWGQVAYPWGEIVVDGFWRPYLHTGGTPSVTPQYTINGRNFYKIFTWSNTTNVIPGSIKMAIRGKDVRNTGRDCRIWRYNEPKHNIMYEHTAYSDTDTTTLSATDTTITITASGAIEVGSVGNLKHKHGQSAYALNSDYYVTYSNTERNTAYVDISPIHYVEDQYDTDARPWEITYRYRAESKKENGWVALMYNSAEHDITLRLNYNILSVVRSKITGVKIDYITAGIMGEVKRELINQILMKPGWNKITVLTDDRDSSESVISGLFDTNDPSVWSNISSYIVTDATELEFGELTKLTGDQAFKTFSVLTDSDGRKWLVVPDPQYAGINEDGFQFDSSNNNPLYDDATVVSSFYGVQYKTLADSRKTRVILRAEMTSNNKGSTPELREYTLLLNLSEDQAERVRELKSELTEGSNYAV